MIKAIETQYQGYRFRSRLEARWAVFFDALGVKWEYEPEGYDLTDTYDESTETDGGMSPWPDGRLLYLPDFWLPEKQLFAEIKPSAFSDEEREKCRLLAMQTGYGCLMLSGVPNGVAYPLFDFSVEPECAERYMSLDDRGIILLINWMTTRDQLKSAWNSLDKEDQNSLHRYINAVDAARGARFEHGENGARRHR